MEKSIFDGMTNLYSLSKTLRFELKPVGKTLENMKTNLAYDESLHTFLNDQNIEDAYQVLKPILDKLHEEFITISLESDKAKNIDFSGYLDLKLQKEKVDSEIWVVNKRNSSKKTWEIETEEKKLRWEIVKLWKIGGDAFLKKWVIVEDASEDWEKNPGNKEKKWWVKVLLEKWILNAIKTELENNEMIFDDFYYCRLLARTGTDTIDYNIQKIWEK